MMITKPQVFLPLKVHGVEKGFVDWRKAGYSFSEVYAELSEYYITLKKPSFSADSVRFFNLMVFDDKPIIGSLENKLVEKNKKDLKVSYPKFDSYDKKITLSDLINDVDFEGGYSFTVIVLYQRRRWSISKFDILSQWSAIYSYFRNE